jgi:hypothetical protein
MRRRSDLWCEAFRPPRAFRPGGRDLDLTAGEDAANPKRLFGADPGRARVAIASVDAVTVVAGRTIGPRFGTAVRRLSVWFAEGLKQAERARPRSLDLDRDARVPARASQAVAVQRIYAHASTSRLDAKGGRM